VSDEASATTLGGIPQAMAVLAVGGTALMIAFASLTRPAARLARWPLASALLGGGWIALGCGLLLGPGGLGMLRVESLGELRPLVQVGLAWIGLLVGLQMKSGLLAAVPAVLWRWSVLDAVASFLGAATITGLVLRTAAPGADLRSMWPVISLVAAGTVGWSGELRSLRGLDRRAAGVASLVQAGAGLGSALAIVCADLISLGPDGSRSLFATLAVATAAAFSLRAVLASDSGSDGRLTLALLGTLALVAGASASVSSSPLPGAFLLGLVVANLRGASMRRLERLVAESEPAVAAVFFLFAGLLLRGGTGGWPWVVAGGVLALRLVTKPLLAHLALGSLWSQPGAGALRAAPVRQAPIAIALAVAALQAREGAAHHGALLAVVATGVASGVLPLLWRRRA
jgi:hypothetical protein